MTKKRFCAIINIYHFFMVFESITGSLTEREDRLTRAKISGLRLRITTRESSGRMSPADAAAYIATLDAIESQSRIKKSDLRELSQIENAAGLDSNEIRQFKSVDVEGSKDKKSKEKKKKASKKGGGCLKSMLKGAYKYGLSAVAHGTIPTTLAAFWATNPNLMPGQEWNAFVIFFGALAIQEGGIRPLLKRAGLNPNKKKK
jgi:hypothetical protein